MAFLEEGTKAASLVVRGAVHFLFSSNGLFIRIASINDFLEHDVIDGEEERQRVHAQFPHVVVVETDFPEVYVAARWCWSKFGPKQGECWESEYPACPIVLATSTWERGKGMVTSTKSRSITHQPLTATKEHGPSSGWENGIRPRVRRLLLFHCGRL